MDKEQIIKETKLKVEEVLLNDEEHYDKHIDYILINNKTGETHTLASNENGEEAIEFTPYTKDSKNGYGYVPEWDYNFDYYIFEYLNDDYSIGYMTDNTHYNLWNSICELYPTDIENKDGVFNYMRYCKDNNITKEYIDKQMGLDTPNIFDIVRGKNKEKEYIQFILGYDLLNKFFSNNKVSDCDVVYDFCEKLSTKFMNTYYYKNEKLSMYEALDNWVKENKNNIKKDYYELAGIKIEKDFER